MPARKNRTKRNATPAAPAITSVVAETTQPAPAAPVAPVVTAVPTPRVYVDVPVKPGKPAPFGRGPAKAANTTKVLESSLVNVESGNYEIKSRGKDGTKDHPVPTAMIFYRGEHFHARGDAAGNFYGGRMVRDTFVPRYRFLPNPEELAAERYKLERAKAKAAEDAAIAKGRDREESLKRAAAKQANKVAEAARKAKQGKASRPSTPAKAKAKSGKH